MPSFQGLTCFSHPVWQMSGLAQFNFIRLASTLPLRRILQIYKTLSGCAPWLRNSEYILEALPFIDWFFWLLLLFSLTGDRWLLHESWSKYPVCKSVTGEEPAKRGLPMSLSCYFLSTLAKLPVKYQFGSSYSLPWLLKPTKCEVWNKFLYIWWWTCCLYPSRISSMISNDLKTPPWNTLNMIILEYCAVLSDYDAVVCHADITGWRY